MAASSSERAQAQPTPFEGFVVRASATSAMKSLVPILQSSAILRMSELISRWANKPSEAVKPFVEKRKANLHRREGVAFA